ncbi:DUF1707 domain-containing protein [Streptomyces echinatus]|uniref:DUF1707 domain-containing protein n=1 Tax=Streptomyces echinatus TaxID=67293 RepID=UPI0037984CDB
MAGQARTPGHGERATPAVRPGHEVLPSDEDRDRALERVRAAVADGRLPPGESDGRLGRVHAARTLGEPEAAASGLPEPGPRDSPAVDRAPTSRLALGVFGGCRARGAGRPGAPRVVVKGLALFGALVVKSPRGVR